MDSLRINRVYDLISEHKMPAGLKSIGSKWVYKIKSENTSKARVVGQGWWQEAGRDCGNIDSPACRIQNIRMASVVAAALDLDVIQLDVQTASLNAPLEEDVYVQLPPGFEQRDPVTDFPLVMKLRRSLYVLRQSPQNWWVIMDKYLGQIVLVALKSDPCVNIYISKHLDELMALETEKQENVSAILILYADDLLIAGKDKNILVMLKRKLMAKFKMTDLGNVSLVLGMQVTQDRTLGHLIINQSPYTKGILQRFGMDTCNPATTTGTVPEISIKQPVKLLNEEDTKR
ncbi:unnamed protein product [Sphacelaria rigidula]